MVDFNRIVLVGNLGDDPKDYTHENNSYMVTFDVAVNDRTKDNEESSHVEWFSVVVWNNLGKLCMERLKKSNKVYIEGKLKTRSWEDKETGRKKFRSEVIAERVIFIGG